MKPSNSGCRNTQRNAIDINTDGQTSGNCKKNYILNNSKCSALKPSSVEILNNIVKNMVSQPERRLKSWITNHS